MSGTGIDVGTVVGAEGWRSACRWVRQMKLPALVGHVVSGTEAGHVVTGTEAGHVVSRTEAVFRNTDVFRNMNVFRYTDVSGT